MNPPTVNYNYELDAENNNEQHHAKDIKAPPQHPIQDTVVPPPDPQDQYRYGFIKDLLFNVFLSRYILCSRLLVLVDKLPLISLYLIRWVYNVIISYVMAKTKPDLC